MTVHVSTAFKERILGRESFEDIFNNGRILIYSGLRPATADMPPVGTLLAQITADGMPWVDWGHDGGLLFARSGPFAIKEPTQLWNMVGQADGTAVWFRLCGPEPDNGLLSYHLPRIDGNIGTDGSFELVLADTAISNGSYYPIQSFVFTIPPIVS